MILQKQSALDITLSGTVGSFKVGVNQKKASFEVKYLLTHVGLNFNSGSDEKLLKELAPVREIFDFRSLDFDEIMQRDIDDSRVSGDLVPYLLDDSTADLVKFFPPIVVVALPIQSDANKPSDYYPAVSINKIEKKDDPQQVAEWLVTQSGQKGQEVFKFEQPVVDGEVQLHDLVKLSFNTSKCKLVIVDGQHRAMALLALYRNLKDDWSDARRKPFESYYREWTPEYIKSFNLKEIKLPMIICTVPGIDENYRDSLGEYDLKKASRSIFLTLNKNARKVSRSRNLLLDDSDLISSFMRCLLSKIKNEDKDFASTHSMEIHNVELDQEGDRQIITSPMAYTGVSHLYYLIEHIMLDNRKDVDGIRKREGKFGNRTTGQYFENALNRLDCENQLGADAYHIINRSIFSKSQEESLTDVFFQRYGNNILKGLSKFSPFDSFARATQFVKAYAEKHADVHIKPMLFDGQGIARVFDEHRQSLIRRLGENYFNHDVPKIESFKKSLDSTKERYDETVRQFNIYLCREYLNDVASGKYKDKTDGDIQEKAITLVVRLYKQIFTTVAFQAALICGFYSEIEKISDLYVGGHDIDIVEAFDEYLDVLNRFFKPSSFEKFKSLISLFFGEASGEDVGSITIIEPSRTSFRTIVHPAEMAPDEWPKYKYLLLEVWTSKNETINTELDKSREYCREQALKSLFDRKTRSYCQSNSKHESELDDDEKEKIMDDSFSDFKDMLKYFGKASTLNQSLKKKVLDVI